MKSLLIALFVVGTFSRGSILAQSDVVEVPFEFIEGHTVLSVLVNGHGPYRMFLDTGSNVSVLFPSWTCRNGENAVQNQEFIRRQ